LASDHDYPLQKPPWQMKPPQQSAVVMQPPWPIVPQQVPFWQVPLQHVWLAAQAPPKPRQEKQKGLGAPEGVVQMPLQH